MSTTPMFNAGTPEKPQKPNLRAAERLREQSRTFRESQIQAALNASLRRTIESWKQAR